MDIAAADSTFSEIVVEFLRHALGQSRDQNPFIYFGAFSDFLQKVVHLVVCRANLDRRVQQSCRPHNLLYYKSFRFFQFVF